MGQKAAKTQLILLPEHLLGLWEMTPRDPSNHSVINARSLALIVLGMYLGTDKFNRLSKKWFRPITDVVELENQAFNIILLGEALYNLQFTPGSASVIAQLKGGDLEGTAAELETGRILKLFDQRFRFVNPTQKRGKDFDIEVRLPTGEIVCCDTKNKMDSTTISKSTIMDSLNYARKRNLPSEKPGFIFLRCPQRWTSLENRNLFLDCLGSAVDEFFQHQSTRIASVKMHSALLHRDSATKNTDPVILYKEFDNPNCKFPVPAAGWSIFSGNPHFTSWLYFLNLVVAPNPREYIIQQSHGR